ncbi:MAG: hypothetical protein JKY87_00225 [Mariprofundus sp.]|nr:hypothetical protein [Mariprofundus sp.]
MLNASAATVAISDEGYSQAQFAIMAIRAVSDLLLNQVETSNSLHMVKPENLQALLDILADQLDAALAI